MLKEKVLKAINQQINNEYYSAFLYLSMSAWFQGKGLPGFANWMYIQYQEELTHGNKFFKYVHDRGSQVVLKSIAQMDTDFENVISVFEKTLEHEQFVTASINKLMDTAISESDHATQSFLKWFIDEQVEEEASVNEILDTLRLINGQGNGIVMLDRELRQRVFVDDTVTAAE
ncbi:MAG: ferritin [Prolixibacteraceae bacterium]|jgi:ferritin|nr:ferritin [Bacteroidales bacterium]HNU78094.1 ferritin [Prolixibacteraceae bacterium]HNZ69378.1 ferritin [Prolixibacteraceae bacterium]HOC85712.1 ferritin [Prolixibacteraceae bacterium]HOG95158.1 ferritin [Prolixibacteraceae bacterium]